MRLCPYVGTHTSTCPRGIIERGGLWYRARNILPCWPSLRSGTQPPSSGDLHINQPTRITVRNGPYVVFFCRHKEAPCRWRHRDGKASDNLHSGAINKVHSPIHQLRSYYEKVKLDRRHGVCTSTNWQLRDSTRTTRYNS